MTETTYRRITAVTAIAVPILMAACFTALTRGIGYPAVLDRGAEEVLAAVAGAGDGVRWAWWGVTASALLLGGLTLMLHHQLARPSAPYLSVVTAAGALAAVFMALDLGQWTHAVPVLARDFAGAGADAATRATAVAAYTALHQYVGQTIGLAMATLASGLWTALLGADMVRAPGIHRWIGWLGVCAGTVLLASVLQPAGFQLWSTLNTIGFGLWALWLVATGAWLLRSPSAGGG